MFEDEELHLLMSAVESVEFLQNKQESELLAKVAGVENTNKLKRLRFADSLRCELRDLFYDNDYGQDICPPAKLDLIDMCERTGNKTHLASMVRDCIELAFRCGYYHAMNECGGRWQAPYRFNDDYLSTTGMELVESKELQDEIEAIQNPDKE